MRRLFAFLSIILAVFSTEGSVHSYIKAGVSSLPGDPFVFLPTAGLGLQVVNNRYGYDISAGCASMVFVSYSSIKLRMLYFPLNQPHHKLYCGCGSGAGYYCCSAPMGGPFGSASETKKMITLEGVIGYEYTFLSHLSTFIQCEVSPPLYAFGNTTNYQPGLSLCAGLKF